jgi:hypothetical protein
MVGAKGRTEKDVVFKVIPCGVSTVYRIKRGSIALNVKVMLPPLVLFS